MPPRREMAEPLPGVATTTAAALLLQSFARGAAVRREARRREHSVVLLQAWARRLSAQGAARRICARLAKQRRSAVELRARASRKIRMRDFDDALEVGAAAPCVKQDAERYGGRRCESGGLLGNHGGWQILVTWQSFATRIKRGRP